MNLPIFQAFKALTLFLLAQLSGLPPLWLGSSEQQLKVSANPHKEFCSA
jgi:hypothetical protein